MYPIVLFHILSYCTIKYATASYPTLHHCTLSYPTVPSHPVGPKNCILFIFYRIVQLIVSYYVFHRIIKSYPTTYPTAYPILHHRILSYQLLVQHILG